MQFNFSYDPGTSLDHMLAFEVAGKVWGEYLQDDVTVNLQIGITDSSNLPEGVIGGALPGMAANVSYHDFRDRYWQDVTSAADHSANNTLAWDNWLKYEHFFSDGYNGGQHTRSETINMTRANAKALGLIAQNHQGLDGYILMSDLNDQGVEWDVTTQTAEAGKLDLLSTALHEVGHALGFVSGIDQPGWLSAAFETDYTNYTTDYNAFVNDYWEDIDEASVMMRERAQYATPLDKFRHSVNSDGESDFTYGSQFSEKFFSIDGGQTALANFASGVDTAFGGDGYQASHWKNQGNAIGVMDPTLALGERSAITTVDLTALDVIGWDIQSSGANTTINLAALENQARSGLANRLGTTSNWLQNNQAEAAELLSEVRVQEVLMMAADSQVYDLNWLNPGGGDSYWLNWSNHSGGNSYWLNWWNQEGGSGWWQMMEQLFQQQSLFSHIDELPVGEVSLSSTDSLTGLNPQQPVVIAGSEASVNAPPTSSPQTFESFDSFADQQTSEDALDQGLAQSYGNLAMLALGNSAKTNGLGGELTGLGQDQLQSGLGLTSALSHQMLLS